MGLGEFKFKLIWPGIKSIKPWSAGYTVYVWCDSLPPSKKFPSPKKIGRW